jgi:hypothetical protein
MAVTLIKHPKLEPADEPLLTVTAIRSLKQDYEADLRLFAELPGRLEAKKRKLDAALMFLPPGIDLDGAAPELADKAALPAPPPVTVNPSAPGKATWAGEMERMLLSLDAGISHQGLLQRLKQTELGERSSPGEKGFYNAIARLSERGLLEKHGGLLYHRTLADRIRASGRAFPDVTIEVARRAGGSASLVVETLEQHPKGLTAPELKKLLAVREDAPKSLREHGQYIYNILSTLIGNGTVSRRKGVYRLAKKQERSSI